MKVIIARPPNYAEIADKFPLCAGVIFAYGDKIYDPDGEGVSAALVAHETVHGNRQIKMGVEKWWRSYLDDVGFRLDEELPAHRAEYFRATRGSSLKQKAAMLDHIAGRLVSPLYLFDLSIEEAKRRILAGR